MGRGSVGREILGFRAPLGPLATLEVLARGETSPEAARLATRGALALLANHLLGRVRNWVSGAREGVGGAGAGVGGCSDGFGIVFGG
jgi:hypothetical protein